MKIPVATTITQHFLAPIMASSNRNICEPFSDRTSTLGNIPFYVPFKSNKAFCYKDFYKEVEEEIGYKNLATYIKRILKKGQEAIGMGKEGSVYDIGLSHFLVKVPNSLKIIHDNYNFYEAKDSFPLLNVGQKIAENMDGITILKRVRGISHGISVSKLTQQRYMPTSVDATQFLSSLKVISGFPQQSFDRLASMIQKINYDGRYIIDCLHSNNLVIDYSNFEFNLIDLKQKSDTPLLENYSGDCNTMIALLLDGQMHKRIYDKLSPKDQQQLILYSTKIIDKCKKASQRAGLLLSKINMNDYVDQFQKFVYYKQKKDIQGHKRWSEHYNDMLNLYDDNIPRQKSTVDINKSYLNTDVLRQLFKQSDSIGDYYLSYLHENKYINDSDLSDIVEQNAGKIKEGDLNYIVMKRLPLTKFDTPEIINHRFEILQKNICTSENEEYKQTLPVITEREFRAIDMAKPTKKMVIISGLPASGKSAYIEAHYNEDFYLADVDRIKTYFPSYYSAKKDNTLHNISRDIMQQMLIPKAILKNKSIIIPTTGLFEYIDRLSSIAKESGYNVEVIYIDISKENSIKNVLDRYTKTGFYVDPYFIASRANQMQNIINEIRKSEYIDSITVVEQ